MSWRLAKALQTLKAEAEARWPGITIWTIGDSAHRDRPSDHNPHPDNGVVSAIDIKGTAQARAVWSHLMATKDPRVEYIIFDGKKSGSDHGWNVHAYTGRNQHRDHIHVSVGRGTDGRPTRPDLYDDPSPWGLAATAGEDDEMLKRGDSGNAVTVFQKALQEWDPEALPEYGADGDFGDETDEWVKRYQRAAEIPDTGTIGGVTAALLSRYVSKVEGVGAHAHDDRYVQQGEYDTHRHGEGKTGRPIQ